MARITADGATSNTKLFMLATCANRTSSQFDSHPHMQKSTQISFHNRFAFERINKGCKNGRNGENSSKLGKERTMFIMTDARHACRKNSYHTDHLALGQITHEVVDVQHISKKDDICTQHMKYYGKNA